MNKNMTLILSLLFTGLFLAYSPKVWGQEATESSTIDAEVIKENVKQRIREVIKGDSIQSKKAVAFTGKLISIANSTLTLETFKGPQMASISALTTFARLPGSKSLEFDDISIDEYVIALGFLNGSEVLDAKRILTQESEPQASENITFYGRITTFSTKDNTFTLENPTTKEVKIFTITKKSDIFVQMDLDQTIPFDSRDELDPNSVALVVYKPDENDENSEPIINDMLIKSIHQANTSPDSNDTATSSADQTPPELRH